MRAGAKRSKPAATAVWVVKRLPALVTASADLESLPGFLHEASGALQHRKGRMPFIQMTDFRPGCRAPPAIAIRQSQAAISCLRRNSGPPP